MVEPKVVVKILGTAQDGSFPQVNCQCRNCSLIEKNPELKRLAASLAVIMPKKQEWHLIDATPDMREQLRIVNESYLRLMNSICLTHAHIGHYTGLMFLGKEVLSTAGLPVYAGKEMGEMLACNVPWKQLIDLNNIDIRFFYSNKSFILNEQVKITPFEVPHRNEFSETFGLMITGNEKQLLYIPDIDGWEISNFDIREMVAQADYCLLDGTFFSKDELSARGRDYKQVPHPLMTDTIEMLKDVIRDSGTKVYFTHLNHTNPAVDPHSKVFTLIQNYGFFVAEEGMAFSL